MEEPEVAREGRMNLEETDEMEDDLADEVSLEDDEDDEDENQSDFLDKPDDLAGDDTEYRRS